MGNRDSTGVVQDRVGSATELGIHDVVARRLKLKRQTLADLRVLIKRQVGSADGLAVLMGWPRRTLRPAPANGVPKNPAAVESL